jgi:hypothetical protein
MLSATPVNSRMSDLKNQVAFNTEGVDGRSAAGAFRTSRRLSSLTVRVARVQGRFGLTI